MVIFEDRYTAYIHSYGNRKSHEDLKDNEYYVSGLSINWRHIRDHRKKAGYNRYMFFGEKIHEILGEMIADYNLEVPMRAEISYNDLKFIWRGRSDAVGDHEIIEFKTTSLIPPTIYEIPINYIAQIQVYMWAFNKPIGQLVFLNRANLKIRQYTIPYNPRYIPLIKEACYIEYITRTRSQIPASAKPR